MRRVADGKETRTYDDISRELSTRPVHGVTWMSSISAEKYFDGGDLDCARCCRRPTYMVP